LRLFVAAAASENLHKAAAALDVSPTAISRSINRLEAELGVELFERFGRGIRLSTFGHAFLPHAERLLSDAEDAKRELRILRDAEIAATTPIVVGFLATLGSRVVPELVRQFTIRFPAAEFRYVQGSAVLLQDRLLSGELDACLSSPKFEDGRLGWHPLWSQELFAVVSAEHPLAKANEIELVQLSNERFVGLNEGYGLRRVLDGLCREAGFVPRVVAQAEEVGTLIGLVGAGFGVTLAPREAPGLDSRLRTLRVRKPHCQRTFGLSWLINRYASPAARSFHDFCIASGANIFAQPLVRSGEREVR